MLYLTAASCRQVLLPHPLKQNKTTNGFLSLKNSCDTHTNIFTFQNYTSFSKWTFGRSNIIFPSLLGFLSLEYVQCGNFTLLATPRMYVHAQRLPYARTFSIKVFNPSLKPCKRAANRSLYYIWKVSLYYVCNWIYHPGGTQKPDLLCQG